MQQQFILQFACPCDFVNDVNPLVTHVRAADPNAVDYDGTVRVYTFQDANLNDYGLGGEDGIYDGSADFLQGY